MHLLAGIFRIFAYYIYVYIKCCYTFCLNSTLIRRNLFSLLLRTDIRTDRPSYRDASPHQKRIDLLRGVFVRAACTHRLHTRNHKNIYTHEVISQMKILTPFSQQHLPVGMLNGLPIVNCMLRFLFNLKVVGVKKLVKF